MLDEGLKEAYLGADRHSWSQDELDDYERASIKEQDEIGRVELAEKKRTFEIAKFMNEENEPIEKIIKYTGLTKEEIKNFKHKCPMYKYAFGKSRRTLSSSVELSYF